MMIGAAGESSAYLSWAVCAALVISGATTVIQAVRIGRIGAGYILLMGSTSAFLAVCVSALQQGGQGLLATLIVAAALVQFALAAKLSILRRIFTPAVAGTVLMLIPVSVAPVIIGRLTDVPDAASPAAAPVTAAVTLAVMVAGAIRLSGAWRLWAPIIGLVAGSATGGFVFGIYDVPSVLDAAWVGLPPAVYAGLDLSFGPTFWALLPSFVFVTLVGAMDTIGDTIAVQRVSWRRPRALDFRAVQGALTADGLGNLLSGLAGTVPNSTYATGIAVELTGVAARAVGVAVGIVFVGLGFLPKFTAVIFAIPGPVVGAYYIVLVALLFIFGMKIVVHEGLDNRKGLIVGLGFWLGVAFQLDWIFPEYLQGPWGELLGNGMTVGGFTVILLTLFEELTGSRRERLRTTLSVDAQPKVDGMLTRLATRRRWSDVMTARVRAVGEETLLLLLRREDGEQSGEDRRMLLVARADGDAAVLEFIAATDEENIEDQMAVLTERPGTLQLEEEVSLRLLRHYASSVRHHQYHDTDVVTVRVEPVASL